MRRERAHESTPEGSPLGAGTREALLRAATRLFAERGFEGVSVQALARAAGVNKALISYHFGGKRALYVAIMRTTLAAVEARLRELRSSRKPPDELVREFLGAFHDLATVQRPFFPALLLREMLTPATRSGGAFDREVAPRLLAFLQVTRGILERGAREGVFRAVDPFLAHIGIVGSLVFYYATEPTRRRLVREGRVALPQPAAESFLEHMQEMVLCGLSKWPGARRRGAKEGEGAHEGKGLVAGARRAGGGRRVPGSNG